MTLPDEKLEVAALSETGYVRNENQDNMSGSTIPSGHLYIVADGMGGHKGGAVAAEMTVNGLQQYIKNAPTDLPADVMIRSAFNEVNQSVYLKARSKSEDLKGMGSTAVLLLVTGRTARVAHVGDSRAYLYRRGRLIPLTTDHTVVQRMVETGMIHADEAFKHPNANILDRAIGNRPSVEVEITDELTLENGDAVLLCSDGLTGYVMDAEITEVLAGNEPVQGIPRRLIDLALKKGGEDNVTVQFIQYGVRKEAMGNSRNVTGNKFWKGLSFIFLFLFIGTSLTGGKFFFDIKQELAATQSELKTTTENAENNQTKANVLKEQLDKVEAEKIDAAQKSKDDELKHKTNMSQLSRNLAETRTALEKKIEAAEKNSKNLENKIENLKEELQKVKKEKDQAVTESLNCNREIAAMKAAAESNVAPLGTESSAQPTGSGE